MRTPEQIKNRLECYHRYLTDKCEHLETECRGCELNNTPGYTISEVVHDALLLIGQLEKDKIQENVVKIMKPAEGSGNELLPCPFCGSWDVVHMQYEHTVGLRWKAVCCGCMAEIDPGYAQEQHTVTAMWNRRAERSTTC